MEDCVHFIVSVLCYNKKKKYVKGKNAFNKHCMSKVLWFFVCFVFNLAAWFYGQIGLFCGANT